MSDLPGAVYETDGHSDTQTETSPSLKEVSLSKAQTKLGVAARAKICLRRTVEKEFRGARVPELMAIFAAFFVPVGDVSSDWAVVVGFQNDCAIFRQTYPGCVEEPYTNCTFVSKLGGTVESPCTWALGGWLTMALGGITSAAFLFLAMSQKGGKYMAAAPFCAGFALFGLAPVFHAAMALMLQDPKSVGRNMKIAKGIELIFEAIPQSSLQAYVMVIDDRLNWENDVKWDPGLGLSVLISFFGAGTTLFGLEAAERQGDHVIPEFAAFSRYGLMVAFARMFQIAAMVFGVALVGCAGEEGHAAAFVFLVVCCTALVYFFEPTQLRNQAIGFMSSWAALGLFFIGVMAMRVTYASFRDTDGVGIGGDSGTVTACSKHSDCSSGEYCDDQPSCWECSSIDSGWCDAVDGSCCSSDFLANCPTGDFSGVAERCLRRRSLLEQHDLFSTPLESPARRMQAATCPESGSQIAATSTHELLDFTGGYDNGADCEWSIQCADAGKAAVLAFTTFDTERGYDFVSLLARSAGTGYTTEPWIIAGTAHDVVEMVGTLAECQAACSANQRCHGFSRDSTVSDSASATCWLKDTVAAEFECTNFHCSWSSFVQDTDWGYYGTATSDAPAATGAGDTCETCTSLCFADANCGAVECTRDGSGYCSWWKDAGTESVCQGSNSHTSTGNLQTCREINRMLYEPYQTYVRQDAEVALAGPLSGDSFFSGDSFCSLAPASYSQVCGSVTGWHSSIDMSGYDASAVCNVEVSTSGSTCAAYCASQGQTCLHAQDNAAGCTLDPAHDRKDTSQNGCLQEWGSQICGCSTGVFVAQSGDIAVTFTSDSSVTRDGFTAEYWCAAQDSVGSSAVLAGSVLHRTIEYASQPSESVSTSTDSDTPATSATCADDGVCVCNLTIFESTQQNSLGEPGWRTLNGACCGASVWDTTQIVLMILGVFFIGIMNLVDPDIGFPLCRAKTHEEKVERDADKASFSPDRVDQAKVEQVWSWIDYFEDGMIEPQEIYRLAQRLTAWLGEHKPDGWDRGASHEDGSLAPAEKYAHYVALCTKLEIPALGRSEFDANKSDGKEPADGIDKYCVSKELFITKYKGPIGSKMFDELKLPLLKSQGIRAILGC